MTDLRQWWRRLRETLAGPLMETANVLALTILIMACLLTGDWPFLLAGLGVEALYLWGASQWQRHRAGGGPSPQTRIGFLDAWLLIVSVMGFVVIMFFGFAKHLLTYPLTLTTHAAGWEVGAIAWTYLFLIYYFVKYKSATRPGLDKGIFIVIVIISGILLLPVWQSIKDQQPRAHVFYLLLIGLCFLGIDALVIFFHDDDEQKTRSRSSLIWADGPMVAAFFILLLFLYIHRDTEQPEVFVSGVVSCQLLFSNAVFVVMEFGFLSPPKTGPGGAPKQPDGGPVPESDGARSPLGTGVPDPSPAPR